MSELSVSPHPPTVSISSFPIARLKIYTDLLQIDPRKQNKSATSTSSRNVHSYFLR